MTLQNIRRYYEQPVIDYATDNSIEIRLDNQNVPTGDASDEFIVTRLNFGEMTEPSLCGLLENIRGSFVIEVFTPKGKGPARAQKIMEDLFCKMMKLTKRPADRTYGVRGTLGPITGPLFTALDERPYFFGAMSMPIQAEYVDTIVYTEGAADLDSIDNNSVLPSYYKPLLKQAVSRWNKLVKYDDATYSSIQAAVSGWNGMRLDEVTVAYEHPTKPGVIASCGPKLYASLGGVKFTTISYKLNIYTKWNSSYSDDDWIAILAHELGHAWGIGTYWSEEFESDGAVVPINNFLDGTAYTNAQAAYNSLTSLTRTKVPLEATGDPGTQDAHWENEARDDSGTNYPGFTDELMVGSISPGDRRVISALTMGGLVDFGWEEVSAGANEGTPTIDLFRTAPPGYQLQPADLSSIQKVIL